jgi:hypothetical protein
MVTPVEVGAGPSKKAGRIAAAVLLSLLADGRFAPNAAIQQLIS